MGLVEAAVPAKWKNRFTRAVAARRALNALYSGSKPPTDAQISAKHNTDYRAMNALPLWLQAIVVKRAGKRPS